MTLTTSTGRTINLNFVHSSPDFETREGAGAVRQALDADARNMGRRLTLCEISQVSFSGSSEQAESEKSYATLAQGVGVTHPADVFEKSTGRIVSTVAALRGALEADGNNTRLTGDEAVDVLLGYFEKFPTKLTPALKETFTKVLKNLNLTTAQRTRVWSVFYPATA